MSLFWVLPGKRAIRNRMHAKQSLAKKKTTATRQLLTLLILVVGTPALWYWWSLSSNHLPLPPAPSLPSAPAVSETSLDQAFSEPAESPSLAPSRGQRIFPYSVIPGGIRSAQELREAARHDALVAQHYSGFDFDSARLIHAPQDKQVYVSYRIGSRIFWTSRKVTIHAGEALLTDGRNLTRGRCGNRISESPKSPASPDEPSDRAMSGPVFFPDPAPLGFLAGDTSAPLALLPAPQTPFPPSTDIPPTGGSFPPTFPPLFLGPRSPSGSPPPPPPPVVSTPEPQSLFLVLLGLSALVFLRFFPGLRAPMGTTPVK